MHFRDFDVARLPRSRQHAGWLEVAKRAGGSAWRLPLLTVTGREDGPVLVVTAGVHGDEYEGVEAVAQVFRQVRPAALRGALIMLPVCNMPAYEAAMRSSPMDGLNLARVFPGKRDGTITQRIAFWMVHRLLRQADFFIDLHSGGTAYNIPTLVGYIYDDGELGSRSFAAAQAFGAPVLWGHPLPVPPGRTISAATDLGVPSLYTEAPGGGYARAGDVACFVQGVLNVMIHLGMLDDTLQPWPMTHHLVGDGDMDTVLAAPVTGYFRAQTDLLDEVTAGQSLGTIRDLLGNLDAEIVADQEGVVIMLRRFHHVRAGEGLAHITQHAPVNGFA